MKGQAHNLMSFGEVGEMLGCTFEDVRRWVMEDRSLKAVLVDPNGHKSEFKIGNLVTVKVSMDGSVTSSDGITPLGNLRLDPKLATQFLSDYTQRYRNRMTQEMFLQRQPEKSETVNTTSDSLSRAEVTTVDRGWVMKKAALIAKHRDKWKTIERDFQDATENGLSKMAKAPGRGNWVEVDALNWARQRGKLNETAVQPKGSPATPFAGLTHRI